MAAEYIFTRHGQSVVNLTRVISNRMTDSTPLVEQIVRKHRGDAGSVVLVSHGSLLVNQPAPGNSDQHRQRVYPQPAVPQLRLRDRSGGRVKIDVPGVVRLALG